MALNERGHEVLDDTPVAVPLRWSRPASTLDQIRAQLKIISREAEQNGNETFQEADDFEIGDDYDPRSPWELSIDQELHTESPVAPGAPVPPLPGPASGNAGDLPVPPQPQSPPGNP